VQEGINTFTTDSGTTHCKKATFEGTITAVTTTSVDITPEYKECRITEGPFGSEPEVTVDHNGCKYRMTATGQVHIVGCTNANKSIQVTAPFCTIEITEQTIEPVHYVNVGAGSTRELVVNSTIANIKYHESGFSCQNPGAKNTTGGIYNGKVRVTGENPVTLKHIGIWWT
jgi:hypothetical protein